MGASLRSMAIPLIAGLSLAVLGLQLGQWQLRRASEKLDIQRLIEMRTAAPEVALSAVREPQEWQRLRAEGRWLAQERRFIDNRVHKGQAGFHLVAPLMLDDGRIVLVNRGWLPAPADRRHLPEPHFEAGRVTVAGLVRNPEADPFRLAEDEAGAAIRQHLEPAEFARRMRREVLPWVLLQTSDAGDGLVRDWPRPDAGIDRHRGYALQWFGLSALAGGLTIYFIYRSLRRGDDA